MRLAIRLPPRPTWFPARPEIAAFSRAYLAKHGFPAPTREGAWRRVAVTSRGVYLDSLGGFRVRWIGTDEARRIETEEFR